MQGKVMALVALSVVLAACGKPEAAPANVAQAKMVAAAAPVPQVDPAEQFMADISGVWAFEGGGLLRFEYEGLFPSLAIDDALHPVQVIDFDSANRVLNLHDGYADDDPSRVISLKKVSLPDGQGLKITMPDGSATTLAFVRKITSADQAALGGVQGPPAGLE